MGDCSDTPGFVLAGTWKITSTAAGCVKPEGAASIDSSSVVDHDADHGPILNHPR